MDSPILNTGRMATPSHIRALWDCRPWILSLEKFRDGIESAVLLLPSVTLLHECRELEHGRFWTQSLQSVSVHLSLPFVEIHPLPDSVFSIDSYAFSCCQALHRITFQNSVVSIGGWTSWLPQFEMVSTPKGFGIPGVFQWKWRSSGSRLLPHSFTVLVRFLQFSCPCV